MPAILPTTSARNPKNNKKVVSATEVISQGAEGIIPESVLEGMAEYYSADLAEKVIRGMTENALKCKYNGGASLPFGYVIDNATTNLTRSTLRSHLKSSTAMQAENPLRKSWMTLTNAELRRPEIIW